MADTQTASAPAALAHAQQFYIDGRWVDPVSTRTLEVINPATEQPITSIALGNEDDVDRAVAAARTAFESFSQTSPQERVELLERIVAVYKTRIPDLVALVSLEMGAPVALAKGAQVPAGRSHFRATAKALQDFAWEEQIGTTTVVYEPVGVCGFITPWNWPLNQICAKVAPALAAGCTMILKPSELAPLNALVLTEILEEAGVPAGVFNLVNGDGPTVGAAIAGHPGIDMVSFTGSTRAGIEVARNAAPTVKRVAQELGGKSANIILEDADLERALTRDVCGMYENSGQSCNAASRILVPQARLDEAKEIARRASEGMVVGAPEDPETSVGPLVSQAQFEKVQRLIQTAVEEGAEVVCGGPGRPEGVERGYYVRPTVLANVTNDMTIAREEIFGPVMTLIAYRDEEDAIRIANDSLYGLGGRVSSGDREHARQVARRLRTGMVHINGAPLTADAPFGGYKQSGNGREYASHGLREFVEAKSIYGDADSGDAR